MSITKEDKFYGKNTAEPLVVRLDNDVMINGMNSFILWDDDKEIIWYYSTNEKTSTPVEPSGTGDVIYAALLSSSTYENIQEIFIPLRPDSFGQSLAVLKAKTGAHGVGDFAVNIPIDDAMGRKIKQKLFDPLDPRKEDKDFTNNYKKTRLPYKQI